MIENLFYGLIGGLIFLGVFLLFNALITKFWNIISYGGDPEKREELDASGNAEADRGDR